MEIVTEDSEPLYSRTTRGRKPIYNWDDWLRHGVTVRLVEGIDFNCNVSSIRQQAYNQAKNRHGTISTHGAELADGTTVVELTFQYTAAYLKSLEAIADEGDPAIGLPARPAPFINPDLLEELPGAAGGKTWGPPSA